MKTPFDSRPAPNSNWPKVSIVTPSFNQGPFLEATIRSVVDQEYPNLEYMIFDGGSTDGSQSIIQRYESRLAYWHCGPDHGQTHALVSGLGRATGDILCWLNSDDLLLPNTLWEVAEVFKSDEVRCVYGDAIWIDIDGRETRPKKEHAFNRFIFLYDHDFIPQASAFWRRDLYNQVGGLDVRYDLAMDADLFLRFSEVTRIRHIRRPWSKIRVHPNQKTQRLAARGRLESIELRRRYVENTSPNALLAKHYLARAMRIVWKLSTGCYW